MPQDIVEAAYAVIRAALAGKSVDHLQLDTAMRVVAAEIQSSTDRSK